MSDENEMFQDLDLLLDFEVVSEPEGIELLEYMSEDGPEEEEQ